MLVQKLQAITVGPQMGTLVPVETFFSFLLVLIFCVSGLTLNIWGEGVSFAPTISFLPIGVVYSADPDRDQCPRKVPKKARFASQVPKFLKWD